MTKQTNTHRPEDLLRRIDRAMLIAILLVGALLAAFLWDKAWGAPRDASVPAAGTGFLVIAPDRGFVGNEETRDAFEVFAAGRNAALAFVTDERTRGNFAAALEALAKRGARRVVVLPLFISDAEPRLALARGLLDPAARRADGAPSLAVPGPVEFARPFGSSYLAVEILADRLRAIKEPAAKRVVVVGYGARTEEEHRRMEADWQRLAEQAAKGFGFSTVRAVVWYERTGFGEDARRAESVRALADAAGGANAIVVPFHLGRKLDSMMTFTGEIRRALPAGAELLVDEVTPHPDIATWMAREANRRLPLRAKDLGVVLLAHGSDYHWNEAVQQGVHLLEDRYQIEYAFSMADQATVERAVRRLERRGARAAVIVRVFPTASAFQRDVEHMIGLDVESGEPGAAHVGHAAHGDHGHGAANGAPAPRIRSALPLSTVGGLEAHPLFARALFDRARELSRDPKRETVILVAHGSGDDAANARWLAQLETMAQTMRANGGAVFRAIRVATWREDWPAKREPWIAKVRAMVQEAQQDGGRALVIPARTTSRGPEREFLGDLAYELGSGFAPHPLFARWFEEQINAGRAALAVAPDPLAARAAAGTETVVQR